MIFVERGAVTAVIGEAESVVCQPSDDFSISGVTVSPTADAQSVPVWFWVRVEFSDVTPTLSFVATAASVVVSISVGKLAFPKLSVELEV